MNPNPLLLFRAALLTLTALLPGACVAKEIRHPAVAPVAGEPAAFAGTLAAHNRWRREVGTGPLVWSDAAAVIAQRWADDLARRDCQPSHSPGEERRRSLGENIYSYWRGGEYEGFRKTPQFVVDAWAGERQWYAHASNSCQTGKVCGHYTQVVSTYSTHLGCGRARAKACEVWVCNYSPPGNYTGVVPY